MSVTQFKPNMDHWQDRVDLAAAFRWTARLNMHEGVANHFSYATNEAGTQFLMNPNQVHFSRVKVSDLLHLDVDDADTMKAPDAPDPTAWGLHGGVHRACPHARCVMHVHSIYATVLACLEDGNLPPIDQNCCTFCVGCVWVGLDNDYGGLALEDEGARCATLLTDPQKKVMVMGSHGVLVIGDTVADTFNRLYYFERAAETYIKALQTGMPLRRIPDDIAEKTARELEQYPDQDVRHLQELKLILDEEGSDYAK